MTHEFAERIVKVFDLPHKKLPLETNWEYLPGTTNDELAEMLGALGYPKFSHLRKGVKQNPAVVLFSALKNENLDSRIAESLPWLVLTFPEIDCEGLVKYSKQFDLQNRLGFVVSLARQLAAKGKDELKRQLLSEVEKSLEKSILFKEMAWATNR